MDIAEKLQILADAAKYGASRAGSGSKKSAWKEVDSTAGTSICHNFTPDGRCISLLKILFTNFCIFACKYCINRVTSDVPRAQFAVKEVVNLTLDFYQRNYIESLFLSSGIVRDANYTMEKMILAAKALRTTHNFKGYIQLKTISNADNSKLLYL